MKNGERFRATRRVFATRRFPAESGSGRLGITLVEALVVVAITGMLIGLLLPVINAARESGRRTQCGNNARQIALAAIAHESMQGAYPSAGWGNIWAPVAGRTGLRQPGSWVWALLPFLERNDLAQMGLSSSLAKREAQMAVVLQTPLAVMHCPSRGPVRAYPIYRGRDGNNVGVSADPIGSDAVLQLARSDYAMNLGRDIPWWGVSNAPSQPVTLAEGDDPKFAWLTFDFTGISYLRSRVTVAEVQARRGTSNIYLVAEKSVGAAPRETISAESFSMYNGYHLGNHRYTAHPPAMDTAADYIAFGSAHPHTWNASFADGHVRALSFDIDPAVHRSLGSRRDGTVFGDDAIR